MRVYHTVTVPTMANGISRFGLRVSSALALTNCVSTVSSQAKPAQGRDGVESNVGEKDDGGTLEGSVHAKGKEIGPIDRVDLDRAEDNDEDDNPDGDRILGRGDSEQDRYSTSRAP